MWKGMRAHALVAAACLFALTFAACDDTSEVPKCTPGASQACTNADGCTGAQLCSAEGTFDACVCGSSMGGSGSTSGSTSTNMSSTSSASSMDSVSSSGSGGTDCDPVTQAPCGSGSKCAWIATSDAPAMGHTACIADGTVDEGGACTTGAPGEATGFDDCKAGLVCAFGECRVACGFTPDTCPSGYACDDVTGKYASGGPPIAGYCQATCDPLENTRDFDGAPACGGGLDAQGHPNLGCYGRPNGLFTCGVAGDFTKTSGTVPAANASGQPYVNGCAPGHVGFLRKSSGSTVFTCSKLCSAGPTSTTSQQYANGIPPFTCPTSPLGASVYECRYWSWFEDEMQPASPHTATLGVCMEYGQYKYDADNNGSAETTYPSCKTLTSGDLDGVDGPDTVQWGCAPAP